MLSNILSNSELEKIQEFYNKGKPPQSQIISSMKGIVTSDYLKHSDLDARNFVLNYFPCTFQINNHTDME